MYLGRGFSVDSNDIQEPREMKFGIFDQNDRGHESLHQQYSSRLELAQLYEQCGFYCYQMSEHHGTPLSTTPSPSVFLAALSQRTKTLRFGPLVYLLPIYNPLRLVEEICMLDQLSLGRFEFGIGRGASLHEIGYFGVEPDDMRARYEESLGFILNGLKTGVMKGPGRYWQYDDVELPVAPYQRPHPPVWQAVGSPESTAWPAHHGVNIVSAAPATKARAVIERYWAERRMATELAADGSEPHVGLQRYIVVADSDAAAFLLGRRAWKVFYESFIRLWDRYGTQPGNKLPAEFETIVASGNALVGSAETVTRLLTEQIAISGANFLSASFMFGDMTFEEGRSSISAFSQRVMPVLRPAGMNAPAPDLRW
jgi:alkanesulfonate monooxygenase SsuD/methylene tetrahydromethanopterin reductase-like flavin-dependent oxidoreductase (luciferase family)